MGVELIVWSVCVLYAVLWLVTWVAWVRRFERESYYTPDAEEKFVWSIGGLCLGAVWPISLPAHRVMESNGGFIADLFFPKAAGERKRKEKRKDAEVKAEGYAEMANKFRGYRDDAKAEGNHAVAAAMDETYRMYGELATEAQNESRSLRSPRR